MSAMSGGKKGARNAQKNENAKMIEHSIGLKRGDESKKNSFQIGKRIFFNLSEPQSNQMLKRYKLKLKNALSPHASLLLPTLLLPSKSTGSESD